MMFDIEEKYEIHKEEIEILFYEIDKLEDEWNEITRKHSIGARPMRDDYKERFYRKVNFLRAMHNCRKAEKKLEEFIKKWIQEESAND